MVAGPGPPKVRRQLGSSLMERPLAGAAPDRPRSGRRKTAPSWLRKRASEGLRQAPHHRHLPTEEDLPPEVLIQHHGVHSELGSASGPLGRQDGLVLSLTESPDPDQQL